ncbi:hypothetical protein [Oligoflexus tunisiensis]|uniref:hypothetical protein n=1 Tax=Oligoflexus tunisiensis TaxID=708132 RepID=UPI00114CB9F0|nr:hypothetical protein [Oligoflexus tunisiensis]
MAQNVFEIWRRPNIEREKIGIKKELDQVLLSHREEGRLLYIIEQINQLSETRDAEKMLRRFILVMSALVHHYRFGGLGKRQINDLAMQGQEILRVVGVKPGHNQVAFLYSELHSILSDIHHSNHEFAQALWERQLSAKIAIMPAEHMARQNLGMGTCSLRLGNAALAIHALKNGLSQTEDPHTRDRIRVQLVKAMRLAGRLEETRELIQESENIIRDESCKLELQWQRVTLHASASQDLSEMIAITRKGMSHDASSYLMELYLWAAGQPKMKWLDRIPALDRSSGLVNINAQHHGQLQSITQSIAEAYDSTVPFIKRISEIKKVMPRIRDMPFVDHELLSWIAMARWLYRNRSYELAATVFMEYKSLSLKLSEGASGDILGLADDLLAINWTEKYSR